MDDWEMQAKRVAAAFDVQNPQYAHGVGGWFVYGLVNGQPFTFTQGYTGATYIDLNHNQDMDDWSISCWPDNFCTVEESHRPIFCRGMLCLGRMDEEPLAQDILNYHERLTAMQDFCDRCRTLGVPDLLEQAV